MIALKFVAAAALVAPLLLAGGSAEASTARQYTFQGQGVFTTSQGVPVNFIGGSSAQPPSAANPPKDFEHHGRYFGGE